MSYTKTNRPAIAMIELIFAIVIIGITLMSAPMLISQAAKSGYVTIQQEGISEAASKVNMIISDYDWDEENTEDNASNTIMETNSTVADLNEFTSTIISGRRIGTPKESSRSFMVKGADPSLRLNASLNLGSDVGDTGEDDIDDFISTDGLKLVGTGTGTDYIEENVTITTSIVYIDDDTNESGYNYSNITFDPDFDNPVTTETRNIKAITVTLTSDSSSPGELDKNIILHAFSCNIGSRDELVSREP